MCFCLLSRELEVPQVRIKKNQQQFRNNSWLTRQAGYRQLGDCISSSGEGLRACICRRHWVSSRKQLPQGQTSRWFFAVFQERCMYSILGFGSQSATSSSSLTVYNGCAATLSTDSQNWRERGRLVGGVLCVQVCGVTPFDFLLTHFLCLTSSACLPDQGLETGNALIAPSVISLCFQTLSVLSGWKTLSKARLNHISF